MEDADLLLEWTDKLKIEIKALHFKENDIRLDFYGMLYDATYNYYRCFVSYKLTEFIREGQVIFGDKLSKSDKHIRRIMETSMLPRLAKSQMNYFNRSLLIDVWSTFELCVTTMVDKICSTEEREKLLNHHYREICKNTTKSSIDDNDKEKLLQLTKKTHLTHVPVTRKTDFLFEKARNYYRNVANDKDFLIFLGKWRNTMHTNFIYHGKDYEYSFGNAHFKFENGKIIKWIDPFEPSPKLYFYIMGNLKEIWHVLVHTIPYEGVIEYPDLEQE